MTTEQQGEKMFDFKTTRAYLYLRNVANGDLKRKDISRREAQEILRFMASEWRKDADKQTLASLTIPNMVKIHRCLVRG
jgi:NAD-dependent DNA ligase